MKKILIGFIIGLLSGLLSSGGGLVAIPCLTYLLKMEEKEARATTVFCILPMVITSLFFYNTSCLINWKLGILCGIGGIIGGSIGTKLLQKLSNKYLNVIFIGFLIYSAIKLLVS